MVEAQHVPNFTAAVRRGIEGITQLGLGAIFEQAALDYAEALDKAIAEAAPKGIRVASLRIDGQEMERAIIVRCPHLVRMIRTGAEGSLGTNDARLVKAVLDGHPVCECWKGEAYG